MALRIAANGKALAPIVVDPAATPAERHAAEELRRWLGEATGAAFRIVVRAAAPKGPAILVGPGAAARALAPDIPWARLGDEEAVARCRGGRLLLAGGRPRGTLYAVTRFLQREVGIRWWTPWATDVPQKPALALPDFDRREKPAFESRNPFWYPAFDPDWAVRNGSNALDARLDERRGGAIVYKGFVHTFYPLIPPAEHFQAHPEWFSMNAKGERYVDGGQLCTTDPALREKIVERVRAWLRESPDARIVSISQNDWYGACLCPRCKAVDEAQGSPSGTMLALVNFVAQRLEKEFPKVAFDTLAYQYTRRAPKTISPRPSVVVRLCSIEGNFRQPLSAPANRAFGDDLRAWSRKSRRLYIWDYTTNFAHYLLPHPNWFQLGENVRFFHQNGVRGLFEQGAYQSHGAEMAELRAWVLAQLLWDPYQDDRKLIDAFCDGYYGPAAGRIVRRYLDRMHARSEGVVLTCFSGPNQPFLDFDALVEADGLWARAHAAADTPERRWRVDQGRNAIRYAVLANWTRLRRACREKGAAWPWGEATDLAAALVACATGPGPQGWKPVTHLNEGGLTPQAFAERFAAQVDRAPLPEALRAIPGGVGVQDGAASLYRPGDLCERRVDPAASDGRAVRLRGDHTEWAVQFPAGSLPEAVLSGTWSLFAVVRLEGIPAPGSRALSIGVYDTARRQGLLQAEPGAGPGAVDWQIVPVGTVTMTPDCYVWIAPVNDPKVQAIWLDRIVFVPAR